MYFLNTDVISQSTNIVPGRGLSEMAEEAPGRARSVHSLVSLLSDIENADDEIANITPDDLIKLSWVSIKHRVKPAKPGLWTRLFKPAKFKEWRMDEGKEILHGVLGEIEPGQMIAMMGGTGAGKSTMLNILAGRSSWGEADGLVRANGKARNPESWRRLASYVEQKDELDPNLTVEEILSFFTFIKLPDAKYDKETKERKVKKLVKTLELEAVAGHHVTTLSDGQKKLLSIGIELAGERRIIFLDEPTTGLDSVTSMDIVVMLKKLAEKYRLSVVMTIHQPRSEILEIFDKILLLAQGSTVYYGDLDEILEHLIEFTGIPIPAHENPADYIMDMTNLDWQKKVTMEQSQKRIDSLVCEWKRIEKENHVEAPRSASRVLSRSASIFSRLSLHPSAADRQMGRPKARDEEWHEKWPNCYHTEIALLLRRYAKTELRCHHQNILLFSEYILLALFYGFVYFQLTTANFGGYQSRQGLCAQVARLIYALTVTNLGNVYIGTRRLIIRERASHSYRISAAFIARSISLTPFRLLCTALFSTIVYFLAGLRTDSFTPFLIYFFFCQLIQITMLGLGLLITSTFNTLAKIVVVTIFLGDLFNAFGGTLVLSPGIPPVLRWLRFLSPFFYCNQGLIQNEVSGLTIAGLPGEYYLDTFFQNQISIMWAAGGLMITAAGYFALGYIALFYATKPNFKII